MTSIPEPEALCPDWLASNTANAHIAKNRGWFVDYSPFESFITCVVTGRHIKVEGIGTVELPTQRDGEPIEPDSHTKVYLSNVLHVPSSLCNIVGLSLLHFTGTTDFSRGLIGSDGRVFAAFDRTRPLIIFKLSEPPIGPQVGPHAIQHGNIYQLRVSWPDSERLKWDQYLERTAAPTRSAAEEPNWLKQYCEGETFSPVGQSPSIRNEEDREEGKRILRAKMCSSDEQASGETTE